MFERRFEESAYKKHKAEAASRKDAEALRWLLSDHRGRWILSKLADESYINEPTPALDTNTILLREGRKGLVLDLYKQIRRMGRDEILLLIKADAERQIWREDTQDSFTRKENEEWKKLL
ncbi:hypothetical protein [Phascolarctobacterium sp.]|uniref:hypothetical protein n=1 Tax=Phascolarctobacterium sp. TaxID=2049039 RepID=UPI00302B6D1D